MPSYPMPIASAAWLHDHLDAPQVVVADCRFSLMEPDQGRSQYAAGHIPGAVYFDLNQDLSGPVQLHGGRHPLPELAQITHTLEQAGIRSGNDSSSSFVVAYDDSRFAFAARLWWLLRYLGHDRVAVLDGGLSGWQRAGYPLSQAVPRPQPGQFVPQVRSHWLVDVEAVRARKDQPQVALVDARQGDRYRGEREPIDPIAGHIPGAVNYFWQEATDEAGLALPPAAHQARWAALQEAEEIMVYCGSGVTACVNLLSLAIAGMATGKLYAGSWSDWCSYQQDSGSV